MYAKLEFDFVEHEDDGDTVRQHIEFRGWADGSLSSCLRFHGRQPTERQLKIIAELGRWLNELVATQEQPTP